MIIKIHRMKSPDTPLLTSIKALVKKYGLFKSTWLKAGRTAACNAKMIGTSRIIKRYVEDDNHEDKKYNLKV